MKVAVFGGSGFVGKYILKTLIKHNYKLYTFIRFGSEHKVEHLKELNIITGDITNNTAIEQTIMNCSAVIYNIGIIREFPKKGVTYQKSHYEYSKIVMDISKKYNIKHFILMSANGIKKDGVGYQRTKYLAEEYLKNSGLNYTIFRPSLIFGKPSGDKEFCSELRDAMIKPPFPAPLFFEGLNIFSAGHFKLSPIHVQNVADFFVKSIANEKHYMKTYHLGGLETFNWKEIIQLISKSLRKHKFMVPAPVLPVWILALLLDRFSLFPITRDQLTMLLEGNTCDSRELFKDFDIIPIPFTTKSLSYLRKND